MQHILIPTDFSIKSLNIIHAVAKKFEGEKVRISLFHLLLPVFDMTQLFRSRRNMHMEMISDEFFEALQILQNRYNSTISNINIEFGVGSTTFYLSNLLTGLKIDLVIVYSDMDYKYTGNRSIDPVPLLKKVGVNMQAVEFNHIKAKKQNFSGALSIDDLLTLNLERDYAVTK